MESGTRPRRDLRSEIEQSLAELRSEVEPRLLQVDIVPEEGESSLHPLWGARIPAVGEVVAVRTGPADPKVYQVIRVEWEVDATMETPYLEMARVHVREVRGGV